jgi:hypothetical protein
MNTHTPKFTGEELFYLFGLLILIIVGICFLFLVFRFLSGLTRALDALARFLDKKRDVLVKKEDDND